MNWTELEAAATQPGNVQEARRLGAYVRFGATSEQLADESRKTDILFALTSPNDFSHWAVQFGGDVVSLTDAEYAALSQPN
jgi:hypothetical protein